MVKRKGWPNEPTRHSLAAHGCKTGRKGSQGRHNATPRTRGSGRYTPSKYKGIADIEPDFYDYYIKPLDDEQRLQWLLKVGKRAGIFKRFIADGQPHLMKGVGRFGIAYQIDPEGNFIDVMDITEIESATGDRYWTEDQVGSSTEWNTDGRNAYVITQRFSCKLTDLIEAVINRARFLGTGEDLNNIPEVVLSYMAYWGGEEAAYHSRTQAWEDFEHDYGRTDMGVMT